MKFELLSGKIERATLKSAAFDLFYAGESPLLLSDEPMLIPTGVRSRMDSGLCCIIKEKSGLALKGVQLFGGVIDADYRDEWQVIARYPAHCYVSEDDGHLRNRVGKLTFTIEPGMKIAQFLIVQLPSVELIGSGINILSIIRDGGFGSTGK